MKIRLKHWQDPVNAALGAWLVVSPWVLGFHADSMAATVVAIALGAALIVSAITAVLAPHAWGEWIEGALGLMLIGSPWALDFHLDDIARTNVVGAGVAILALVLWTLMVDRDYNNWSRDGAAR